MKYLLIIILSVIVLTSCEEVFFPEVDTVEPVLYIEGMYTTHPSKHEVKVLYTRSFNEQPYYPYVADAMVEIEDSHGNIIPFYHKGSGIYRCDTHELHMAVVGESYVLRVTTSDGEVFESLPQTVMECPDISSLYCKYAKNTYLDEYVSGGIFEVHRDGIQIICETRGILSVQNYFFYRWTGYEQHVNIRSPNFGGDPSYLYGH